MTLELILISALTGAIGLAILVAAIWSAIESHSYFHVLKNKKNATSRDVQMALLMTRRSVGRAMVVLLISTVALIRLSATDLLVTASTYVIFTLLLFAQIIVGWFVWMDVKEKTLMWPYDYPKRNHGDDTTSPDDPESS